jgi:hypothetical protein
MKIQVQLDGRRWYTYSAPDSLAVGVGDRVTVPGLWSDTAVGIVREIGSDYEGPLKIIYGVIERGGANHQRRGDAIMSGAWVVVVRSGDRDDDTYVYGPLDDGQIAARFADFMTTEVDPARAYRIEPPTPELLLFWNRTIKGEPTTSKRPVGWPPSPGEVWQDRGGDRWVCARVTGKNVSYLTCLARMADDNAEEIWRQYGPMTRVQFVAPTKDEEPPF